MVDLENNLEKRLYLALKNKDGSAVFKIVSAKAIIYFRGKKYFKDDFVLASNKFEIQNYELKDMEEIISSDKYIEYSYTLTDEKNAEKIHITSTWENIAGEWKLIFLMDSNV